MKRWALYLADRFKAETLGDPLLGTVEADTEEQAKADGWQTVSSVKPPFPFSVSGVKPIEVPELRAGDTVKHGPSGETWELAYADGLDVCPMGWPQTLARAIDCTLLEPASDAHHRGVLERLATGRQDVVHDRRTTIARHQLAKLNGEPFYRMRVDITRFGTPAARREVGEGPNLCDAVVLLGITREPNGNSTAVSTFDGATDTPLDPVDQFKAWAVWAETLAEHDKMPDGMVNFLRQVVAGIRHAARNS